MSRHHEHQHFFQCGRHALNNLCGEEWATTVLLTAVAEDLVASQGGGGQLRSNPYFHWAGAWVGEWDIMVIIGALKKRGLEFGHHIIYNPCSPERLQEDMDAARADLGNSAIGFIVNEAWKNWIFSGHHWYAIAPQDTQVEFHEAAINKDILWQNRDSKLAKPTLVEAPGKEAGSTDALFAYLMKRAREAEAQIFLVRTAAKASL